MKLNSIWVVHDPTHISELIDILYEAKGPNELASLIIGTGLSQWKHERTTLYSEEGEARKDAESRMKKREKEAMTDPLASRVAARFAAEIHQAAKLQCDQEKDCKEPVSMIDNKGWTYCTKHGEQRKSAGVPCRKMKPAEIKKLEEGGTIKYA